MAYLLTYEDRTFTLVHTGVITIEEINESNGLIHGHPEFDFHRYQVVHLLGADFSEIELTKANQPGATDSAASITKRNVKVALIVQEAKARQFCRDYINTAKRFGASWDFQLFDNVEAAQAWFNDAPSQSTDNGHPAAMQRG